MLAACCWIAPDHLQPFQSQQIQAAANSTIDWKVFLQLTSRHRVAAIAAANLRRHAPHTLPDEWRTRLSKRASRIGEQALCQAAELAKIGRVLAAHQIAVLPLKGPLLSLNLFGQLGLRDVRDIDILIEPAEVWRTDEILHHSGYRRTSPDVVFTPRIRAAALQVVHHFAYVHEATGTLLELHWRLTHWHPAQIQQLWHISEQRNWMSVSFHHLPPGPLLAVLCDHGAHHHWSSVKWLGDVATLISQIPAGAWEAVIRCVRELDVEVPVAQAALLCESFLSIPIPDSLQHLIQREKAVPRLAAIAVKVMLCDEPGRIFSENPIARLPALVLNLFVYRSRLRKRFPASTAWSQINVCLDDCRDTPLPDRLFFLYTLLRPLFWLRRRLKIAASG